MTKYLLTDEEYVKECKKLESLLLLHPDHSVIYMDLEYQILGSRKALPEEELGKKGWKFIFLDGDERIYMEILRDTLPRAEDYSDDPFFINSNDPDV